MVASGNDDVLLSTRNFTFSAPAGDATVFHAQAGSGFHLTASPVGAVAAAAANIHNLSPTTKYVVFGGVGLAVILGVFLVLKR